ncbi:MAG: glycosyltransferase family 39 protein [Planctomycetes bacterium]|nr:glycosyltransferase family 39 protein [Planctomycetota bacterium]
MAITLAGILGAGCWLRFRDLTLEPMQWDEVENYQAMRGLLERGFPSHQAHPDVPVEYTHTSELVMVSMGLVACGTDSDRLIVRLPGAVWSTLTILLIFFVGRRLFHTSVGLTAASLLALSPVCIAMSNFGRYFGLFQFFTLLTVYLYWLTLQGNGPIHRRTLWLTAGSFLVMFLSWEATALVAPGMIVAALVQRRGRLRSVVWDLQVWAALVVVGLVVVLQYTHQVLQKTQFLWYGTSLSDVDLQPMWRYPVFQPLYYLWYTSWSQDALLPALGFGGACLLALRHGFRKPVRFLLLIHLTTALLMASVLSALAWRYVHHLIPLLILLASAAIVALARAVVRLARQPNRRGVGPAYAWGLGAGLVATFVVLGSGLTLQLADLLPFRLEGYGVTTYKFPYMGGAADYLRDHLQPGDAVLALDPFQVRHLLGPAAPKADLYWPESVLLLPATLADHGTVPIDRRDGTVALPDLESIQDLFARSGRVWFVVRGQGRARLDDDPSGRLGRTWFTVPSPKNQNYNTTDINLFLRDNMEVVYEDEQVLVLLRDRNHWPASLRRQQDAAISGTKANYLP